MTGSWKAQWKTLRPVESPASSWLSMLGLALLGVLVVAGVVGLRSSPPTDAPSESVTAPEPDPVQEDVSYDDYGSYDED